MKKAPPTPDTSASMRTSTRMERDTMGELPVPSDAYYGVQTARAIENFPISSLRFPRAMIRAMGLIKRAAAGVNQSLNLLDKKPAEAIRRAATEVVDGHLLRTLVLELPDERERLLVVVVQVVLRAREFFDLTPGRHG